MESAPTRYGHSDNPLSCSSLSPIGSPESVAESLPDETAEASIVSIDGKKERAATLPKEPPLPIAGHKDRSGWLVWPDAELIPPMMGSDASWRWIKISNIAFEILGWHDRTEGTTAGFHQANAVLKDPAFEWKQALLERYEAGTLTKSDLANVLAVAGINPPAAQKEEVANG